MERIKKLLKFFDFFGVDITFHYQGRERYNSPFGGILFIIFILISLTYFLLILKSFINKDYYSFFIFDQQLNSIENISLKNYSYDFSFSLNCDNYDIDLMMFFEVKLNQIIKLKNNIRLNKIDYQKCSNSKLLYNNENLFCLVNTSNIFLNKNQNESKHFEINLISKENKNNTFNSIKNILQNYNCHLNIHLQDIIFNPKNHNYNIKKFYISKYISLLYNSQSILNVDLKTLSFKNIDNYLFDLSSIKYYLGINSLNINYYDKGYDRFENQKKDFNSFSKIIIKSDNFHTNIIKKNEQLSIFISKIYCFPSFIFLFISLFQKRFNRRLSSQSVIKRIFKIKREDYNYIKLEHMKQTKKSKSSQHISNQSKPKNSVQGDIRNSNYEHLMGSNKMINQVQMISFYDNSENKPALTINSKMRRSLNLNKTNNISIYNNNNNMTINNNNSKISDTNISIKNKLNNTLFNRYILLSNDKKLKNQFVEKEKKYKYFSYSCFDNFMFHYFPCCLSNNKKLVSKLFRKAKIHLFLELDIITFLRRNQQLDILMYVILNKECNQIIKYISQPNLSKPEHLNHFYKSITNHFNLKYNGITVDDFYKHYQNLNYKSKLTSIEEKILELAQTYIHTLINA